MKGTRTTVAVWAAVSEVLLCGTLLLTAISPSMREVFGSAGVLAVLLGGAVCLAVALVAMFVPLPKGMRWALAVLLAALAGGVVVVALPAMVGADAAGVGLVLLLAAAGMGVVAAQTPRVGPGDEQARETR